MSEAEAEWEQRNAALWATIDDCDEEQFVARVDALAAELPAGNAIGLFERACARDSTGHSDLAVPLYEAALAAGLSGVRSSVTPSGVEGQRLKVCDSESRSRADLNGGPLIPEPVASYGTMTNPGSGGISPTWP